MKSKYTLQLPAVNGGPFNCRPADAVEIPAERILCNNVVFPWEFNPHKVQLFVIGNEFGALGAVWADCDQDALDELVNAGLGDGLLVAEEDVAKMDDDEREELSHLGNAGEAANLDHAWIRECPLTGTELFCAFAEARGAGQSTLDN